MKCYELTFMDPEHGKVRRWKRNKREIDRFVNQWKKRYPLRKLLLTELIWIPTTNKDELLEYLDKNFGGGT